MSFSRNVIGVNDDGGSGSLTRDSDELFGYYNDN